MHWVQINWYFLKNSSCTFYCALHGLTTSISKRWSVAFIVTMLLLSDNSSQIIHSFPTFSFLFFFLINFSTYYYTLSNFFPLFYLFISPLLFTLISLLFYLFVFLYFFPFHFPSSYYKFIILSLILYIFAHIKGYILSISLSQFFFSFFGGIFYFSCISTLGWWIFSLFGTLLWVNVIKLCF